MPRKSTDRPAGEIVTTESPAATYEGLSGVEGETLKFIHGATVAVYGHKTMNETTRPDCFQFLFELLRSGPVLDGRVDYLEIGSFRGASLVALCSILRALGRLGSICSVDPYFPEGYAETPPHKGETIVKNSTESTMKSAQRLWQAAGLDVEHIRDISKNALAVFLKAGRQFDFIYVDGNHEKLNPLVDTALSLQILRPDGFLMLDDINWPDIRPVATLCERHLKLVGKGFNKACFQVGQA